MAFYVGQKVVCVDATPRPGLRKVLKEGAIYTISRLDGPLHEGDENGVDLVEVPARGTNGYQASYRAVRFRPITERKTSIEIFKAMLNPSKTEVEA